MIKFVKIKLSDDYTLEFFTSGSWTPFIVYHELGFSNVPDQIRKKALFILKGAFPGGHKYPLTAYGNE